MQEVTTTEELEAAIERQDPDIGPILVQFGSKSCSRCGPFTEAVEELRTELGFEHLMVTVEDSPELVEQFGVAKLPAFVVLTRVDSEGELVQAASPEEVRSAVRVRVPREKKGGAAAQSRGRC